MGMTTRQAVAILGAHTLGRLSSANSGFDGPWTVREAVFDNEYYINLVRSPWSQQSISSNFQWEQPPPPGSMGVPTKVMLNVDMALLKEMNPDGSGQETIVACRNDFNQCTNSVTNPIVRDFEQSNTQFMQEFGPAFEVLSRFNATGLVSINQSPRIEMSIVVILLMIA